MLIFSTVELHLAHNARKQELLATIWKYDDLGAFDLMKVHITIIAGDSEEFKDWLGEYEAKCYRAVSMDATEQSGERLVLPPPRLKLRSSWLGLINPVVRGIPGHGHTICWIEVGLNRVIPGSYL